jgi:hypothetical protein
MPSLSRPPSAPFTVLSDEGTRFDLVSNKVSARTVVARLCATRHGSAIVEVL